MRGEFLDLGGVRLYYYASGPRSREAPPVVLIHGFAASAHVWAGVAPLVARGRRVVVLDLLGHGRSDPVSDHALTIGAHAERVIALLDALQVPRACVVGHEIGGAIAQRLAIEAPARVSHLGLVCSAGYECWPSRPLRAVRRLGGLGRRLPPALLHALLRREWHRGYARPDRGSRSTDLYLRPFAGAAGRNALVAHLRQLDPADTVAMSARLGEIEAPAAVVWGAADRSVHGSVGVRLAADIPNATPHPLTDVCHFAPEEAPEQVAAILEDLLHR